MQTKERTHAQNKFHRRIANRRSPGHSLVGQPINGELTPTEIAHKARRRLRRARKLDIFIQSAPKMLATIDRTIEALELRLNQPHEDEELAPKELQALIKQKRNEWFNIKNRLGRAEVSLNNLKA